MSRSPAPTAMRRFSLTFEDAQLEDAWWRSRSYRWRPFAAGAAVSMLVWLATTGWLTAIAPASRDATRIILLVVEPAYAACIVAARLVPLQSRRTAVAVMELLLSLFAGLAVVMLERIIRDAGFSPYGAPLMATYLFMLHTFPNTRFTRFVYKQAGSWVLIAAFEVSRHSGKPITAAAVIDDAFWMSFAQLIGSYVAYTSERQRRRLFLQRRTIEEERAKSERLEREAHEREVQTLASELKRQVADRSRELAEALAQLHRLPQHAGPSAGELIDGRYRVHRRLGNGAMGAVYEAERLADGKRFAIKVLGGAVTPQALARFAREAQLAAQLRHHNLVELWDVGIESSGRFFMVMELVAGGALEAHRKRFGDAGWALPILGQVAAGLAAIHQQGIVHRDLKPANVLLTATGIAKIADFGVAGLAPEPFSETVTDDGEALTRTGVLLGTPRYMAPELATGARDAQPSADIFSFGIMAYEMLAGESPFSSPPIRERLAMGAVAAVPAPKLTAIDGVRAQLFERCIDMNPSLRPSATELIDAIIALQSSRSA